MTKDKGYPKTWSQIAHRVKLEAEYKCRDCDHPDNFPLGYTLTVHHLDGDPTNNTRANLRALCQRCHLKRQARLRKYGPEGLLQMPLPIPLLKNF